MATRFSEIATYLYSAMVFAIFPFAAQLAKNGKEHTKLILKSSGASIAFCIIIAAAFCFFARPALSFLPHGEQYAAYWWAVPWLIGITSLSSIYGLYITAEIAANRFRFLKWAIPLDAAYPILLLLITGHGYFSNIIPSCFSEFLYAHNIRSLDTILWWMTVFNGAKALCCIAEILVSSREQTITAVPHN